MSSSPRSSTATGSVSDVSGTLFEAMMIDQFDEMLAQSARRPLVYSVVTHPSLIGQPYRLRAFRQSPRRPHHCLRRQLGGLSPPRCAS